MKYCDTDCSVQKTSHCRLGYLDGIRLVVTIFHSHLEHPPRYAFDLDSNLASLGGFMEVVVLTR